MYMYILFIELKARYSTLRGSLLLVLPNARKKNPSFLGYMRKRNESVNKE